MLCDSCGTRRRSCCLGVYKFEGTSVNDERLDVTAQIVNPEADGGDIVVAVLDGTASVEGGGEEELVDG